MLRACAQVECSLDDVRSEWKRLPSCSSLGSARSAMAPAINNNVRTTQDKDVCVECAAAFYIYKRRRTRRGERKKKKKKKNNLLFSVVKSTTTTTTYSKVHIAYLYNLDRILMHFNSNSFIFNSNSIPLKILEEILNKSIKFTRFHLILIWVCY